MTSPRSEPDTIEVTTIRDFDHYTARNRAAQQIREDAIRAALENQPPVRADTGIIDPDQAGSMVMLAGCIIAGMVLTFIVAIGWGVHHQLVGRIDRLQADLKALQTFASCDAPKRPGDATVITYRRNEHTVAARCQVITNPLDPERALK